ncbi:MAG: 30S ribosomal protein S6 [Desulfatitalea sp.]|nr:30S ribosomal protein S6 [Desulfatitalea sp.]NNJ99839.1 30S ribosomal protein S6 [Desulfatitalea sp.]
MRRYETIVILDPDLPEEGRTSLLTRVKEIIVQQEGVFIQEDSWGVKKLAYSIKKKPRGYYVRLDYCGMGKVVDEMERFFRIDDRALKYLTVQLDSDADAEKILAEIAAAQAQQAAQAAASAQEPSSESEAQAPQPVPETAAESDQNEETTPES